MRDRAGFTLIEMLLVILIVSLTLLMMRPRASQAVSKLSVQSAMQDVGSSLRRARTSAIQRGKTTRFVRHGDTIKILIDSSNISVSLTPPINLLRQYKVTLTASRDTITYDPRGLAVGLTTFHKFYFTRGTNKDSVCVSRLGRVSSVLGVTNAVDCVP